MEILSRGAELKLYDNAEFLSAYLDFGLYLPFSNFDHKILLYYNRVVSQYTAHFFILLSILKDIDKTVGYGPLSIDDV